MIIVTLGTQDKPFSRLLKELDKQIENKKIKDKIIVQAGYTKYNSINMEIFDYIPGSEFDKLISNSDILITHGGVGSILTGVKNKKKVIATPRLKKHGEHTNDHQLQIIKQFSDMGYIIPLYDLNKLAEVLDKAKTFKPKEYKSQTKNMIKLLEDFIDKN